MGIHVALNHRTSYRYDRPITLAPQIVRLRPAPHCRTPILSYSLTITPKDHFINWQQDPFSNYLGRLVFPEKTAEFQVEVDLVAEMIVINPFDFFLEPDAETFPFVYEPGLKIDLGPYLAREPAGEQLSAYLAADRSQPQADHRFSRCPEPAVEPATSAISSAWNPMSRAASRRCTLGSGSCRDSAWLLVNILRHLGLAARFVSGYLIQLKADVKSLDGPSGPEQDFTDLHAWTEVYLPGAGWVGMDPDLRALCRRGPYPAGLFAGTAERSSHHRCP